MPEGIRKKAGESRRKQMHKKFRIHHILCTSLYEGKGYSSTFCENMSSIVEYLHHHPDEKLTLVAEPDIICANCPNRTEADTCSQDLNHVVEKDRGILKYIDLTEGAAYSYRELCRQMLLQITPELFEEICGSCAWKKQGLCRYEDLISHLSEMQER